jgi:hypothetical protein
MIKVTIHFRASGCKQQRMTALPRQGDYLTSGGRLWRVDCVVFGPSPQAFVIEVANDLAEYLESRWATWTMADLERIDPGGREGQKHFG